MRIAVIDDEEVWRNKVAGYLQKNRIKEYDLYADGKTLLAGRKLYDVLFMDIELEEENGFVVANEYRKIYPKTLVIILTTHTELSRQGYRINAFRYIDKLFLYEIEEALESAERRVRDFAKLRVEIIGTGIKEMPCTEIYYFEAARHKVRMCTKHGDYDCKDGISKYTEKFTKDGFYLIHRAYLVNLRFVKEIYPDGVVMENGDNLCISRRKYTDFRKTYMKWKLAWGYG